MGADFFVVPSGTYAQVRQRCIEGGGDLASIHSQADVARAAALCAGQRCEFSLSKGFGFRVEGFG